MSCAKWKALERFRSCLFWFVQARSLYSSITHSVFTSLGSCSKRLFLHQQGILVTLRCEFFFNSVLNQIKKYRSIIVLEYKYFFYTSRIAGICRRFNKHCKVLYVFIIWLQHRTYSLHQPQDSWGLFYHTYSILELLALIASYAFFSVW